MWGQVVSVSLPLKISALRKDGVVGTGFILYQCNLKPDYEMTIFKILGIRWQKIMTPEIRGLKEVNPTLPKHAARRQFPGVSARKGNSGGAWQSPRWLGFAKQSIREGRIAERQDSGDLWKIPSNLHLRTDQHTWEKGTHGWGKKHLKALEGTIPGLSYRAGKNL